MQKKKKKKKNCDFFLKTKYKKHKLTKINTI